MREKISIVIPCYYSEENLIPLVEKIKCVMTKELYDFEIIMIDDGSLDKTYNVIKSLAESDDNLIGVRFSKNFGQHSALIAGYSRASGDIIVGLNDDGEQDPVDIPKLINKLKEGYDYVCASHDLKGHKLSQKFGSKVNNYCYINLLGQPKGFYFSSYYAMNRFLVDEIIKNKNPFLNINGLILSITKNVADVDIPLYERKFGKSGYSIKKSLNLWLNTYTSYTTIPLRISLYFSVLCLTSSILFVIIYIFNSFNNLLLVCSLFLFLFSLLFGVLFVTGEYLGRLFMISNGHVQYIVKDEIGQKDEN